MEFNTEISARHMSSYVNALQGYSARRGKQADLMGAASGYGGYSYCPQGIPIELALCLLLAGFALAFGILYRAVTQKTGRRRKRVANDKNKLEDIQDRFSDMFWWGRSSSDTSLYFPVSIIPIQKRFFVFVKHLLQGFITYVFFI
jgi:hypothetical protein